GIDIPTLRDVWATAPYLHRGSAPTIADAIQAHNGFTATATELANLAAYVAQIGNQESSTAGGGGGGSPATGTGLTARYFNNLSLAGAPVLERLERVNFLWSAAPGPGVASNQFSVRWSGQVEAIASGNFQFQTRTNDGARLWIDGHLVIDNWTQHATTDDQSPVIALTKNARYTITLEYYDHSGTAVARLYWKKPGATTFGLVPLNRLYAN
ncbi:MAG: PA14 domain-containing protein, partial [Steroidobacteraceae bacterium]